MLSDLLKTRPQFCRLLARIRISCLSLALVFVAGYAPPVLAQSIEFPHENISDLRGLINVFSTFRQACLTQPTNAELPAKIAPEGYKIYSRPDHLYGEDTGGSTEKAAVLSKTGSEQEDWDGGHIFIDFLMPTDKTPDGRCIVKWKRAWDYEEGRARLSLGLYGVFDAQISFHLEAILNSRPNDSFIWKQKTYAGVSDWYTFCWDGKLCTFKVLYEIDPDSGIDISIFREAVQK